MKSTATPSTILLPVAKFCSTIQFKMLVLLAGLCAIPMLVEAQPYNSPCTALLYTFNNGLNLVPCGPAANTTPDVHIDGNGPGIPINGYPCGTPGNGGSPTDVLWVTFVIQDGGSFEWQTVPGSDEFYWEMFYATDPVDQPSEETTQSSCMSLQYLECGTEFTGWKIQSTPDPSKHWRFYLVFFLRNGDQAGDGVVKIRKSCGEACLLSTIDVVATGDACINIGGSTQLNATASGGGGGPYSYIWTPATGLSNSFIPNPLASPVVTTIYTVTAKGADLCPASDMVTVTVGGCCDAEAGTITNNGTGPFTICKNHDIIQGNTEIIFDASGENTTAGYLPYAFILADANGNIIAYNTTGNFGPIANVGTYTVYGLSYATSNMPASVLTFLGSVNTIAQIQSSLLCLELVSGAPGTNVIKVVEPECGNF